MTTKLQKLMHDFGTPIILEDDEGVKPRLEVRWRDFVRRDSQVRRLAVEHYRLPMAPWGFIWIFFAGAFFGGVGTAVGDFVDGGYDFSWGLLYDFGGSLAMVLFCAFLVVRSCEVKKPASDGDANAPQAVASSEEA